MPLHRIIKIDIDANRIINSNKLLLILVFLLLNIIKGVVKNFENLLLITSLINEKTKNEYHRNLNINP